MADEDWKNRAGLSINLSSSDEDDDNKIRVSIPVPNNNRKYSVDHNGYDLPIISPNFITEFPFESFEEQLGRTPPRTRIARNNIKDKKFRDHVENVIKSSKSHRRRNSSVEVSSRDDSLERNNIEYEYRHRRKRSLKLLRESERDIKLDMSSASTTTRLNSLITVTIAAMESIDDRADSMPASSHKVETCKRFLSVASKPVLPENDVCCPYGENECPKDRVGFYNTFSVLIKMGNSDKQQDSKASRKQQSQEDAIWQSELKDLIWLELQAWLADKSPTQQDLFLCESRKNVGSLLAEIAAYRFIMPQSKATDSVDSGVDTSSQPCNCLSMFCTTCIYRQSVALDQVEDLLSRLDAAVALYPSSKAMAEDHAIFNDEHLSARLKSLCLWFNMTRLHRLKVKIIGKLLYRLCLQRGSNSSATYPWPFMGEKNEALFFSSPSSSFANLNLNNSVDINCTQRSKPVVQFRLGDLESPVDSSTSPSESNSSTGSSSMHLNAMDSNFSSPRSSSADTNQSKKSFDMRSPYRAYIEEVLKSQGVKKAMQYLDRLHEYLLKKAHISLDKSNHPLTQENVCNEEWELRRYGHWSPEAQSMGLPSYRPAFLFLARIAIDLIHEYLKLRLEQKPSEPSPLSIRQLMREMKEGLKEGVKQRQRYVHLMRSALWDAPQDIIDRLEQEVADFDRSMKAILEIYLEYLQQWVLMVQKESVLVCPYQKSLLEEEWKFVKLTCPYIPNGEALAANSFCRMASGMLSAIVDNLNSGLDDLTNQLDESSNANLDQKETNPKQTMLLACRGVQAVFHEARERALRAIAFAKTLRKDLEIAASFEMTSNLEEFLIKLWQAGHVRVVAPHSCNHLMFVPACLKDRSDLVCRLLNMNLTTTCNRDDTEEEIGHYLLLARYDHSVEYHWPGETINIQPTAETTITLSHIEVQGVLLVVCNPCQLSKHRRHLSQVLGSCVNLVQESLPSNYTIAESLSELKLDAVNLRDCITWSIQIVENRFDMSSLDEIDRASLVSRSREILHQCFKVGFEYNKEVSRLITGKAELQLAIGMIQFAKQWMKFVVERCERGRGLRPRWAAQGLDFLMAACEPDRTKHLTDDEFNDFKNEMNKCVAHVIGSADKLSKPEIRSRGTSPIPQGGRKPYKTSRSLPDKPELQAAQAAAQAAIIPNRSTSCQPNEIDLNHLQPINSPVPSRHQIELHHNDVDSNLLEPLRVPIQGEIGWKDRVSNAVLRIEKQQNDKLKHLNLIGNVTNHHNDRVHIKAKSVTFSWQRGIKIGQGRFGKVYTAVNNATGELMAMKEISFQPNDHKTIRSVAEELHIFEGIHHKHLVRYYGVEIHREEMLIFMEYCEEGTLETLIAAYQSGLPEQLVRNFTRQLLSAVSTLHYHGIVHRDIKSANIFLTDEGNCLKLGDFGSAVKIKTHTTMPGELMGYVGTQAYMAPEVFMKSNTEGHGRAVDIWSVGCVVIEMASGKRPWNEYDSNYQIMFKVGMGELPAYPDNISEEGHAFLDLCLQHEPRKRATADELLEHSFVKVDVDSDEDDHKHKENKHKSLKETLSNHLSYNYID